MYLLPGLKTVRITGTLAKTTNKNMATLLESKDVSLKPKKFLSQKEKQDIEFQRNASQKEIENLDKQFRALYVELNKNREQFGIRAMKKKRITPRECPRKREAFSSKPDLVLTNC